MYICEECGLTFGDTNPIYKIVLHRVKKEFFPYIIITI